jgi:DNA-directed RNA polymerase alpha subunit
MTDRSSESPTTPRRTKPKPSPSDASADGLPAGLSAPARRALAGAGIATLDDLALRTEADVLRLHGMGPKAMEALRHALADRGRSFAGGGR